MAATRLSTQRLKRKVLYVCSDARFLGDEIVRLANKTRNSGRLLPRLRYEERVPTRRSPGTIIDMAADADAALRLPLDTEKKRHHDEERSKLSVGQFD
jgi:hypothetical protein